MTERPPHTHIAYAVKRESGTTVRWLEIGIARIAGDGSGTHEVYIDRQPIGGFNGRIHLSPVGVIPQNPATRPARPGTQMLEDGENF